MEWSEYQKAIFSFIENEKGSLVVEALAGSAKTTSLIECTKRIPKNSSSILVAFNKKIADELKSKADNYIKVNTLHAVGLRVLSKKFKNIVVDYDKMENIFKKVIGDSKENKELIFSLCKICSIIKSSLASTEKEINELIDLFDIQIPENCDRESFINHASMGLEICKFQTKIVDFDDMIWLPLVLDINIEKYDHVFLDEGQDMSPAQIEFVLKLIKKDVGRCFVFLDRHQCIEENTLVNTEKGNVPIKDLTIGDKVYCYNNGKTVTKKILKKEKSIITNGINIKTLSGKEITVTHNHKMYFTLPMLNKSQHIVYLMFRAGFGFRIGKTNKLKSTKNPFGNRMAAERAERLWIIKICESDEEARFWENYYSLEFSIPTAVFCGAERGLNQININKLFDKFGNNGFKLLEYKFLNFDYPHWIARNYSNEDRNGLSRQVIHLVSHSYKKDYRNPKNSRGQNMLYLEWKNPKITELMTSLNYSFSKGKKNNRFRKYSVNYLEMVKLGSKLSKETGFILEENLSNFNGKKTHMKFQLGPASMLYPLSKLITLKNVNAVLDEAVQTDCIIEINEVKNKTFYDIQIEDSGNYFANDILNHNCIYAFRGADENAVNKFIEKLNAKILPLPISYRLPLVIVKEVQKLVPNIEPYSKAIEGILEKKSHKEMLNQAKPGDVILSRTNAPLVKIALSFIKRKIPTSINGKDLGDNLFNLVKNSKCKDIKSFQKYLIKWKDKEIARLIECDKNYNHILDKYDCLMNLMESSISLDEVKQNIKNIFNETNDKNKIICSNIHQYKGKENDTIFLLINTCNYSSQEEKNITYVGKSRAKKEMYYVTYEKDL